MEIRDVVGNLREDILQLKLAQKSLRAELEMIERFTWNLITLIAKDTAVEITLETLPKEADSDDPTLF